MKESNAVKIIVLFSLILILVGGFFSWRNGWVEKVFLRADIAGIGDGLGERLDYLSLLRFAPELAGFGQEKTYLLLFYNNLELRPTGGYLGNFGIAKVENGKVNSFETHDTNIFDGFGQVRTEPPAPLKEYLGINNWQMRDSNWSPDWPAAAAQAEYFYHLQGGQENFDGVIALNASVLPGLLGLTGPIYLEEFDQEFNAENVLYQLEYEVEKGYVARGIDPGERKLAFKTLVKTATERLTSNNFWQNNDLRNFALEELNKKNILFFSKNCNYFKSSHIRNNFFITEHLAQFFFYPIDEIINNAVFQKSDIIVTHTFFGNRGGMHIKTYDSCMSCDCFLYIIFCDITQSFSYNFHTHFVMMNFSQ